MDFNRTPVKLSQMFWLTKYIAWDYAFCWGNKYNTRKPNFVEAYYKSDHERCVLHKFSHYFLHKPCSITLVSQVKESSLKRFKWLIQQHTWVTGWSWIWTKEPSSRVSPWINSYLIRLPQNRNNFNIDSLCKHLVHFHPIPRHVLVIRIK